MGTNVIANDIITEDQKRAVEVLAQNGYKVMELEFNDKLDYMEGTFLCTVGTCTLVTLPITKEGKVVVQSV